MTGAKVPPWLQRGGAGRPVEREQPRRRLTPREGGRTAMSRAGAGGIAVALDDGGDSAIFLSYEATRLRLFKYIGGNAIYFLDPAVARTFTGDSSFRIWPRSAVV